MPLRPALGVRVHAGRVEDPPARSPGGAALQASRGRCPGALRHAVRPLRHPVADARRSPGCGCGPGSAELHPYSPGGAPDHGIAPGFFPLRFLRPPSPRLPRRSFSGSSRGDPYGPIRASSSARCRTTRQSARSTGPGPNRLGAQRTLWWSSELKLTVLAKASLFPGRGILPVALQGGVLSESTAGGGGVAAFRRKHAGGASPPAPPDVLRDRSCELSVRILASSTRCYQCTEHLKFGRPTGSSNSGV